jgi:hypothetical protein
MKRTKSSAPTTRKKIEVKDGVLYETTTITRKVKLPPEIGLFRDLLKWSKDGLRLRDGLKEAAARLELYSRDCFVFEYAEEAVADAAHAAEMACMSAMIEFPEEVRRWQDDYRARMREKCGLAETPPSAPAPAAPFVMTVDDIPF